MAISAEGFDVLQRIATTALSLNVRHVIRIRGRVRQILERLSTALVSRATVGNHRLADAKVPRKAVVAEPRKVVAFQPASARRSRTFLPWGTAALDWSSADHAPSRVTLVVGIIPTSATSSKR